MAKLRITQTISSNGETKRQKENLRSLGIRRIRHTVEVEDNPITRGMLAKVAHLVKYEVID
ncbi:MAG: 50S ribosomal protein L30 [Bacteroidales bacterium]|jgi:large subunit ribosomal protein L30|nr:50S ribosomal protein L30 [Bacteroidales bacterium]MBR3562430.1 50S ribosomal protein L30 [Bacteroidales bacterium]